MKSFWQYLIKHERAIVVVNLLLILALCWQLKSKNDGLKSPTDLSHPPGREATARSSDASTEVLRNVAGTWEMSVQKRSGTQTWTLKLKQDGEHLTGVINSEGGDLSVVGTIQGQTVNLFAKRFGFTVEFPAVLNADGKMTGAIRMLSINRQWTQQRRT